MTYDRFSMEQQIMKCWNVTEDIKEVCTMIGDKGASEDEILNALIGIQTLTESRFDTLFKMFEQSIHERNKCHL